MPVQIYMLTNELFLPRIALIFTKIEFSAGFQLNKNLFNLCNSWLYICKYDP